jgi:hypothetical protein
MASPLSIRKLQPPSGPRYEVTSIITTMFTYDTKDLGKKKTRKPQLALDQLNLVLLKEDVDGNHHVVVRFSLIAFTLPDYVGHKFFQCSVDREKCCHRVQPEQEIQRQGNLVLRKFFPQVCCDLSQ